MNDLYEKLKSGKKIVEKDEIRKAKAEMKQLAKELGNPKILGKVEDTPLSEIKRYIKEKKRDKFVLLRVHPSTKKALKRYGFKEPIFAILCKDSCKTGSFYFLRLARSG
jgi:hypothetical protein